LQTTGGAEAPPQGSCILYFYYFYEFIVFIIYSASSVPCPGKTPKSGVKGNGLLWMLTLSRITDANIHRVIQPVLALP
jgi:hypothetical protein